MIRVVRSQIVKLARPGVLFGVVGLCLAFTTAVAVYLALKTSSSDNVIGKAGKVAGSSHDAIASLEETAIWMGVLMLALFGHSIAAEFSTGTIRNLLVREPRRGRILAGMVVTIVIFAVAIAAAATLLAVAATFAASSGDADLDLGAAVVAFANTTLVISSLGILGGSLGVILRSPSFAISLGIVYVLIGETVLKVVVPDAGQWGFATSLFAVMHGGSEIMTNAHGALVVLVYTALFVVAAGLLFRLRDINS